MQDEPAKPVQRPSLHLSQLIIRSSLYRSQLAARTYLDAILENPRSRRMPLVTLSTLIVMIGVHYAGDGGVSYVADGPWYGAPGSVFSHASDEHLWFNCVMLMALGPLFELTEGVRHTASVIGGGGILGAAMHGCKNPGVPLRGTSGAIYAIMASQLSLLAQNWHEMTFRWLRLFSCAAVVSLEILLYLMNNEATISYWSHYGGAMAGIFTSLIFCRIVRLRRRDVALMWLGMAGYSALVMFAFSRQQVTPAIFGALLIPFLAARVLLNTQRAFVRKRTQSQIYAKQPELQRMGRRSTLQPILRHGTHRCLVSIAALPANAARMVRTSEPSSTRSSSKASTRHTSSGATTLSRHESKELEGAFDVGALSA